MPKLLTRRQYQIVALAGLALVWGVAADLCARGVLPYAALADLVGQVLAALFVWALATFAWVLLVLPLRLISDAPSLALGSPSELAAQVERARAELRERSTPDARRRYHLRMLGASIALGLALGVGVAVNVELAPESILLTPAAWCVACALLAPYHLVRAVLTR